MLVDVYWCSSFWAGVDVWCIYLYYYYYYIHYYIILYLIHYYILYIYIIYTILFLFRSYLFFLSLLPQSIFPSPLPLPIFLFPSSNNRILSFKVYVSALTYGYLYSPNIPDLSNFWPRMFYRSGWLRCVGFNVCVFGSGYVLSWYSVFRTDVDVWCYIVYYIIYYYYYILYYTLLIFWSSPLLSYLLFPSSSFPIFSFLFSSVPIYSSSSSLPNIHSLLLLLLHNIHSIRVGTYLRLFMFSSSTIWPRTN